MSQKIFEYEFSHPQNNLIKPNNDNPEEQFSLSFSRFYKSSFNQVHHRASRLNTYFIREVPIFEAGIADLLVFSWNQNKYLNIIDNNYYIRSFEFKITNWRRGIMQAYRYRNYANASILVMPMEKIRPALNYLSTFQSLRVGLWGFDIGTNSISKYYTPRPQKALNPKIRKQAVYQIFSQHPIIEPSS